ncbi:MAG TPA: cation:proton antiporter [Actinomycetota bacterium]|jgi:Kef-type K+ transport system membrane component KefB|nr:cation:proton antiporter [Actinomycetota bacterium]
METGALLLRLALLFVVARLAAEVAERLHFPAVLAEIGAGVLLGPSLFGWIEPKEPLSFIGELGAILLLLEVGLHMDLADLGRVGRSAMQVAWIGILVPLAAGFAGMRVLGIATPVALFLAAGITATSVGITARVFADMRALTSTEAQTVLGAAIVDDVLGLLILTVVTRVSSGGRIQFASIAGVTVAGILFVVGATALGAILIPRIFGRFVGRSRIEGTLIGAAVAFGLCMAGLAAAVKLAPIVGAFVAGVALSRTPQRDELRRRLAPVGHLFVPVFFLLIGAETHVRTLASPRVLAVAAVLAAIAVVGKIVSALGVTRGGGDRMLIGIGMIPRGEVGLVFATLGLSSGVLSAPQHATLLAVVLVTTLAAPPWLRRRIDRSRREAFESVEVAEPPDGWLLVTDDEVELRAEPSVGLAHRIALDAALLCAQRRPGPRILNWLSGVPARTATWDAQLSRRFMALLRDGNTRSWRFLEVTGMLQVLLPKLEIALARRAHDPFDLDPASALRWDEVDELKRIVSDQDDPASARWPGVDQEAVLLAALARSAFGPDAAAEARALATYVGFKDDRASLVEFLVAERDLLPAAAARMSMGTEESVLALATHIGDRSRCDALYVLAAAGEEEPTARKRLDELRGLVSSALASPELTSAGMGVLEERRRQVVELLPRTANVAVQHLLEAAPRRYLLGQTPQAIAKHIQMLDPPPTRGEVRIRPEPDPEHGTWTIFVAALDRPGALAAIAGALTRCEIPVLEAAITTWPHGLAADVFRVSAPATTDWDAVRKAATEAFAHHGRNGKPARIPGQLEIDNAASPWHTIVEVRAEDRSGLLYRVAEAFSRADLRIHHANVSTVDGVAVDTFLVTDRDGHKLGHREQGALRLSFEGKLGARWTPARMWRRATPQPEATGKPGKLLTP